MARILVHHFSPMPNKITGITVYTWCILEALVRHGRHDYVLATNWDPDKLPPHIAGLGLEVVHRPNFTNETLALLRNTVELPRLARRLGCAAIFHPQPTAMIAGMDNSVVVIHDLYRVTHAHLFNAKQRLQWEHATARGFRKAGSLLAVSEATRAAVVAAYPETAGRAEVVHEASPIEAPTSPVPRPPIDRPYSLMVANITRNKNVGLLIEALKILADRGERPCVRLVGRDENGVLPSLLGQRTDLDFELVGAQSDDQLRSWYAHAAAYVNTSLVEGFCLPLLEAHTFGLPVICSDLPVLREVAGDAALFVDPNDPATLADALTRLHADPNLAETLSAAAQRNVKRFSWQRAAVETEALLDKVMI